MHTPRIVRAPRGSQLSAKSWLTEAPLRMLMNNLDPEVAERPEELVVYGGIGKAARNWEWYDAIVAAVRRLGIVQGTYETCAEAGRQHCNGDWSGKWILTAGLGGMGGAQPLAATMNGASLIAIECDPARIEMRLKTGYLDAQAKSVDEAAAMVQQAGRPISIGLVGNAAELLPQFLKRAQSSAFRPSLVTDQTSAHDPAHGYLPEHWSLGKWK